MNALRTDVRDRRCGGWWSHLLPTSRMTSERNARKSQTPGNQRCPLRLTGRTTGVRGDVTISLTVGNEPSSAGTATGVGTDAPAGAEKPGEPKDENALSAKTNELDRQRPVA